MYSVANLRLSAFALSLTLLLGTAACNRDKDATPDDETELTTNSEDQAILENDDATVAEMVEADAPAQADMARPLPVDSVRSHAAGPSGCATRTWDPTTRTLTIDFGTIGCICRDGRTRRGIIQARFEGTRYTPGSLVIITRTDYYVNNNQLLGTKTITFTDYNRWHVSVVDARIVFANNGGQATWQSERDVVRTATPGQPTTFTVTGQASGVNRRGAAYTAQIQTPLVKRREMGCAGVFVDGTVQLTRANGRAALLNYNPTGTQPAPCDRTASITIGSRTRTFELR